MQIAVTCIWFKTPCVPLTPIVLVCWHQKSFECVLTLMCEITSNPLTTQAHPFTPLQKIETRNLPLLQILCDGPILHSRTSLTGQVKVRSRRTSVVMLPGCRRLNSLLTLYQHLIQWLRKGLQMAMIVCVIYVCMCSWLGLYLCVCVCYIRVKKGYNQFEMHPLMKLA